MIKYLKSTIQKSYFINSKENHKKIKEIVIKQFLDNNVKYSLESFKRHLKNNRNIFYEWRYFFENDTNLTVNIQFLKYFEIALNTYIQKYVLKKSKSTCILQPYTFHL